jgi:hypothetical protein
MEQNHYLMVSEEPSLSSGPQDALPEHLPADLDDLSDMPGGISGKLTKGHSDRQLGFKGLIKRG